MAGFAFDGSGSVMSWAKGRLARARGAPCELRAMLDPVLRSPADHAWYKQVQGDREFSSAYPAMHALNPHVIQLTLSYVP